MISNIKIHAELRMEEYLKTFQKQINKLCNNRASPNLLDDIVVQCYNKSIPLCQLAHITVKDAHTLKISVFDHKITPSVNKAIINSNLGLNPNVDGKDIYILLPLLTDKRRKDLTKLARYEAEQTRILIRNVRRNSNEQIKILLREKKISEDDDRYLQNSIQQLTNVLIKKVDTTLLNKEVELMKL